MYRKLSLCRIYFPQHKLPFLYFFSFGCMIWNFDTFYSVQWIGHQLYTDFSKILWILARLNVFTFWINQFDYLRKLLFFSHWSHFEQTTRFTNQWALSTEVLHKSVKKNYYYAEVAILIKLFKCYNFPILFKII